MKVLKLALLFIPLLIFSQNEIIAADFDGDQVADKIYIEENQGTVTYQLSSQNFKKISTDDFRDSGQIYLHSSKNGFKVNINQMRAGNSYQFRFEKTTGKMRLIGMWRTEFGPANNDGSGESSVNLLTNNYIPDWNYYDVEKSELIRIPTIKKRISLPKTYFSNVGNVFSKYVDQDYKYYMQAKSSMQKSKK